jgi:hypothetical protein
LGLFSIGTYPRWEHFFFNIKIHIKTIRVYIKKKYLKKELITYEKS